LHNFRFSKCSSFYQSFNGQTEFSWVFYFDLMLLAKFEKNDTHEKSVYYVYYSIVY